MVSHSPDLLDLDHLVLIQSIQVELREDLLLLLILEVMSFFREALPLRVLMLSLQEPDGYGMTIVRMIDLHLISDAGSRFGMTSAPLHLMIQIFIFMKIFASPAPYLTTTSSGMAPSWRVCGPTPSTSIVIVFLYAWLVQHWGGADQGEGALVGQGPALVTGMSTPGARGSARQGTREGSSAM